MQLPLKPNLDIAGDRGDRIMERSGELVGLTRTRAVWRFGFLPESDAAKAYGVHCDDFIWILSNHRGEILAEFKGYGIELPDRFNKIIQGSF